MKQYIAEHFYNIAQWPLFILLILLGKHEFNRARRLALAGFFYGNGLIDKEQAETIFLFYNKTINNSTLWNNRLTQFRALFDWLAKMNNNLDPNRHEYYYYSIMCEQTIFFDGFIRDKNGQKKPYK